MHSIHTYTKSLYPVIQISFLNGNVLVFSTMKYNLQKKTISSCLVHRGHVTWIGSRVNWLSRCPPVNYKQTGEIKSLPFTLSLYFFTFSPISHSLCLSLRGAPSGSSRLSAAQCGPLSLSSRQPRQSPGGLMQAGQTQLLSSACC